MRQDGKTLYHAPVELKNDREVLSAAMEQYRWSFKYASKELRNDREVVLAAVKQSGWNLQFASEALVNDREIVLESVKKMVTLYCLHLKHSRMTVKLYWRQ